MWIFELTKISPCVDVVLGRQVRGVQLCRWNERTSTFEGRIGVRHLNPRLSSEAMEALWKFIWASHGLAFNDSKWVAIRALLRKNKPSTEATYFCSELVAAAYQAIGVLPPAGASPNNYIPADFASSYQYSILKLLPPYELLEEELLAPSGASA